MQQSIAFQEWLNLLLASLSMSITHYFMGTTFTCKVLYEYHFCLARLSISITHYFMSITYYLQLLPCKASNLGTLSFLSPNCKTQHILWHHSFHEHIFWYFLLKITEAWHVLTVKASLDKNKINTETTHERPCLTTMYNVQLYTLLKMHKVRKMANSVI